MIYVYIKCVLPLIHNHDIQVLKFSNIHHDQGPVELVHNHHYANTPMLYTAIFHGCKNVNFQMKKYDIIFFLFFALNY